MLTLFFSFGLLFNRSSSKKKSEKDVEKGPEEVEENKEEDKPKLNPNVVVAQKRMQQTAAQVDEVTEIMRANVEKVLERDAMISQLDERADALKEGAEMFEKQAGALKSKYWWKNIKMIAIMAIVGIILLIIIFNWLS